MPSRFKSYVDLPTSPLPPKSPSEEERFHFFEYEENVRMDYFEYLKRGMDSTRVDAANASSVGGGGITAAAGGGFDDIGVATDLCGQFQDPPYQIDVEIEQQLDEMLASGQIGMISVKQEPMDEEDTLRHGTITGVKKESRQSVESYIQMVGEHYLNWYLERSLITNTDYQNALEVLMMVYRAKEIITRWDLYLDVKDYVKALRALL